MNCLIIGGDRITPIESVLYNLGINDIDHWDGRKNSVTKKSLPKKTECVVLLTNFIAHNTMRYFKAEAKKKKIPCICAKRSESSVFCEFTKIMGFKACQNCARSNR